MKENKLTVQGILSLTNEFFSILRTSVLQRYFFLTRNIFICFLTKQSLQFLFHKNSILLKYNRNKLK